MADYTVIADTGNAIVKLLQEAMVPEVIQNTDSIGVCTPADRGDFVLGVYLYDIRESGDIVEADMRTAKQGRMRYPSKYLDLYYMLTAYSVSDIKYRSLEEQRILGRALQALQDHPLLHTGFDTGRSRYPVKIEPLRLDSDEKIKLWNIPNVPYKLSLYYKVFPVELESARIKEVQRVRRVDLDIREMEG